MPVLHILQHSSVICWTSNGATMINSRALGTSAGLIAAITFVICGVLVALAPGTTSAFFGWVLHIDLSSMARPISVASFIGGLILFSAFVGLCVGLTSALYNRLTSRVSV